MRSRTQRSSAPSPAQAVGSFLKAIGPQGGGVPGRGPLIALAVMLSARHLDRPLDLLRALEMALVQDLADPAGGLDPDNALHLRALLLELDGGGTSEARLVLALGDLLDGRPPRLRDRFLADLGRALETGPGSRTMSA